MNERGFSHIEVILSFTLFLGFLIFAFFFFSPFSGKGVLDSSLVYAFTEITKNTTIPLESYATVINDGIIVNPVRIEIDSAISNPNVRVENKNGTKVNSYLVVDGGIEKVHFNKGNERFFTIFFSEDFSTGQPISGGLLVEGQDYSISSSEKKEVFSEKRLLELNAAYGNNYETLKKYFNLPNRVDFGFSLEFDNGDKIIATRTVPENLEVLVEQERVEIIRNSPNDGDIMFANLLVRVW